MTDTKHVLTPDQEEDLRHLEKAEKQRLKWVKKQDRKRLKAERKAYRKGLANVAAGAYPESYAGSMLHEGMSRLMGPQLDMNEYIDQLSILTDAILDGDESNLQRVLGVQLYLTNKVFVDMLMRMDQAFAIQDKKTLADLALKFQNQSRRTAATLIDIRHPKYQVNIGQANIAHNQQINTAEKNRDNEVLEDSDGERMDTGTKEEGGQGDPPLAALD